MSIVKQIITTAVLAGLTLHATGVLGQLVDSSLPIEVEADATGADARTGKVTFTKISIRQGPLSIAADNAESSTLGFDDSTWTFEGNVRLDSPQATLNASRLTLRFLNKRIQRATLAGSPLQYTNRRERGTRIVASSADVRFTRNAIARVELSGTPIEMSREATEDSKRIEGRANSMTYDAETDNLELSGAAELGEGTNRITGNQITYNLSTRQVLAAANEQGDGRVHITINPSEDDTGTPDDASDADEDEQEEDDGSDPVEPPSSE